MFRFSRRSGATSLALLSVIVGARAASSNEMLRARDSMDVFYERILGSMNARIKTVKFDDPHADICPQVTSFIYSSGRSFDIFTPTFSGRPYPAARDDGITNVVFANRACRYTMTVKKFLFQDGGEVLLRRPKFDEARAAQIREQMDRIMSRPQTNPNPIPQEQIDKLFEVRGNTVVILPEGHDPDRASVTETGGRFDHPDGSKEYTGFMYFAPKHFVIHLVDAKEFAIEFHKDSAKKSYEINIADGRSRLNLSIVKEVMGNGWTVVFGE
jgi:hypothetical protein